MTRSVELPFSFQHLSLPGGVRAAAERNPAKLALKHRDKQRTYGELMARIDQVCAGILGSLRLKQGDHAGMVAANCIEYLEVVLGASQAGVGTATVNPRLAPAEIVAICDDAEAQVLFVDGAAAELIKDAKFATVRTVINLNSGFEDWLAKAPLLESVPEVEEWATFTIPYTSGTTGKPKGVLVPHRSRVISLYAMAVEYGCFTPDDRFLAIAPMCHGAGVIFALAPEPEAVIRKFGEEAITGFFGVPTHFHAIFGLPQSFLDAHAAPTLHTIISNAAPLPQAMKEKIIGHFGPILHETYGSTEASIVSNLRPPDQLRKQACVGQAFPGTRIEIRRDDGSVCEPEEVGELFANSACLFNGYWKRPDETAEAFNDGWVTVGDLAKKDSEGHLYIVDRKKDMIISGGINIYPREIEEVLIKSPAVADAAVIGVPDEKWGERLKAFVVAAPGGAQDAESLIDCCESRISSMKVPKDIVFIDILPRNASGKVLKTELRKLT